MAGCGDPAQTCQLQPVLEHIPIWLSVQHPSHVVRETRGLPDTCEACPGVVVQESLGSGAVQFGEGPGEDADVRDGEVEALGAGRRDDVGGVAGQDQASVAHGFVDVTAHRCNGLGGDRAAVQRPVGVDGEAGVEFVPDAVVGPVVGVGPSRDLQVEAGDMDGAHAVQGEAALPARVDQFVAGRCHVGEDPEPGVRVVALVCVTAGGRERAAGDAVEAVAADDPVADECLLAALVQEPHDGRGALRLLDRECLRLPQQRWPFGQLERDEILHDLGLGVDRDGTAAGEGREVDVVAFAFEAQLDALVDQALGVEAFGGAGLAQSVDRALLQHPGALALFDVLPGPGLQDDTVDARAVQQPGQEQTGGAAADDADRRTHGRHAYLPGVSWTRGGPPSLPAPCGTRARRRGCGPRGRPVRPGHGRTAARYGRCSGGAAAAGRA